MKYYSEITDKVYDSVDELNADEKRAHEEELEFQRREQERKAKAEAEAKKKADALKRIDDTYLACAKAIEDYRKEFGTTFSFRDAFPEISEILDFIL